MTDETRRRLLVLADEAERHARDAAGRGELLSRVGFLELALQARSALATPEERLTTGKYLRTLERAMDVEHREAISDSKAGRQARSLLKAARVKGIPTLTELAKKLSVNPGFLSQAVNGKKNMPADLVKRIRDLTGWEP